MAEKDCWTITRRAFCASPLVLGVPALGAAKAKTPQLAGDVMRYVKFGVHRAGTVGEKRSADWLKSRLTGTGYRSRLEPFAIRTLLDPAARIILDTRTVTAFPQWLPPEGTLNRVITGPLLALSDDHAGPAIRIVPQVAPLLANWSKPLDALVEQAVRQQAIALILSVNDPSDDLFVCNQHRAEPFAIPVLLVARHDLAGLAAAAGQQVQVRIQGKMAETKAINVIGARPGRGKTIVISTPLTGWFHCGAERGPGIALWLALAEQLAQQDRPVLMLGTGAHEIGQRGMEHALAHGMAPKPAEVAIWLHLGASLAAIRLDDRYHYKTRQYLVGTEISKDWAQQALGATMPVFVMGNPATLGEAGQILGAGHRRFVGLSGQFPTFHTPLDLGQAVDFARLDQIGLAAAALVRQVAALPDA